MPTHRDQIKAATSDRERITALAEEAAASTTGVVRLDGGLTGPGSGPTLGPVVCAAGPDGRYEVRIGLAVEAVPLDALAQSVREAVTRAVAGDGLGDKVGEININIRDVIPADGASG